MIEHEYHLRCLDLYSGEIWHTNFGHEILNIIYTYIKDKNLKIDSISIASNCSFTQNAEAFDIIQKYINQFAACHVSLTFSVSIDGAIIDNYNRPFDSNIMKDDKYYDKIFSFAIHNGFGFHPMLAAENIELWPENWEWWKKQTKKYGFNLLFDAVMMLEVRNDNWTPEKINSFCNFMKILLKDLLQEEYENDVHRMTLNLLGASGGVNQYSYVPCILSKGLTIPSCTIANTLTVRLGDLAICPCHRLAANKNLYGHFIVEDGKIVDINSNNVSMAVRILTGNNTLLSPKCNNCIYSPFCLKGCFGSQYENNNDPFMPLDSVCNLLKEKIYTNILMYEELGIIKELQNIPSDDIYYHSAQTLLNLCEDVKNVHEKKK